MPTGFPASWTFIVENSLTVVLYYGHPSRLNSSQSVNTDASVMRSCRPFMGSLPLKMAPSHSSSDYLRIEKYVC